MVIYYHPIEKKRILSKLPWNALFMGVSAQRMGRDYSGSISPEKPQVERYYFHTAYRNKHRYFLTPTIISTTFLIPFLSIHYINISLTYPNPPFQNHLKSFSIFHHQSNIFFLYHTPINPNKFPQSSINTAFYKYSS